MRLSTLASGMLALCFFAGCDDDDDDAQTGARLDGGFDASAPEAGQDAGLKRISMQFRAQLGDQGELACGQTYAGQGSAGSEVTPKDFRFYVQSVMLHATTGEEVPLVFDDLPSSNFQTHDVALIDFTTSGGACDGGPTTSNTRIVGVAPANLRYDGVHVVIGVPEALNHGDPVLAPAPLQAPGASWDWTAGYRFLIAEVLATSIPDAGAPHAGGMDAGHSEPADAGHAGHGGGETGVGFIHLGSTGCTEEGDRFRCANANRAEFTLTGFDPERDAIMADLGAVFATADLRGAVQCHGAGPSCEPMFEQLGVDLGTGTPRAVQNVFSVASQR